MAHTHPDETELKDPVCGMTVKADTPHRTTHDGHEVLFCSAGCKTKFHAEPGRYLKPAAKTEHSCCSADGAKAAQPGGQDAGTIHHQHSHAPSGNTSGQRLLLRMQSGPARCTRRSCGMVRVPARSAGWRLSR
jgi:Cu+-exporting ATPase